MEKSKEILKKAGVVSRIKLKGTGPHKVKIVGEKIVKGTDYQTGIEREELEYILEEDGEKKRYNVAIKDKTGGISYFIERMAEFGEGDEIILEYKPIKGTPRGYIDVRNAEEKVEESDDNIPTVNEEEKDNEIE